MNKVSKAFKALGMILRRPSLLNLVLDDEHSHRQRVAQKYAMGEGLPVIPFHDLVPSDMRVEPYAFLDGGCLPTDLALLRALCRMLKAEDYLEIGTWRGESLANVAAEGPRCVSINLPDETMREMGMSHDYIAMHRFFSRDLPNVEHIQADSRSFDFTSLKRKFDLIFIDGDHHTESIIHDTRSVLGLLKNENAVVVWHDYAFSPESPRFSVLSGILQACDVHKHRHLYHVSHSLCAIYMPAAVKRSGPLKINTEPEIHFSVGLKSLKR
jgi:predicted O-methyltransferase YrrM